MIRFSCPRCKTTLEVPDSKAGHVGECAACRQRIQVPSTFLPSAPPPPPVPSLPQRGLVSCPDCNNKVSVRAFACPVCGRRLPPQEIAALYRAERVKSLATLILFALVGLAIWVLWHLGDAGRQRPANTRQETEVGLNLPVIPGLAPVDVYLNFENKGFELDKVFDDPQSPIWRCTENTSKHSMMVETFGKGALAVTLVRGTYQGHANEDADSAAKSFLGYLASLPYEGSDPSSARSWVISNLGTNAKTKIGNASFELIVHPDAPRFRMLLIRPAD